MKNLLLNAVKTMVYIVALFCLLSFLGGFSDKQSILLALLFYAVLSVKSQSVTKELEFVPFNVFLIPNLYNILQDFDLVKSTEDGWAEIRQGIEKLSKEQWNIWNQKGFSFSFITRELIYNKDWHGFSNAEVELNASLEPAVIVREKEKPDSMFRHYSPYLNLKSHRERGCVLRLTLLDWHWEKIKGKEIVKSIPQSDVSLDQMCGTVEIILARVPPQEFGVYAAMGSGYNPSAHEKAVQVRKEARARFGWKGKPFTNIYGRETDADHNNEAEHRYGSVAHRAL